METIAKESPPPGPAGGGVPEQSGEPRTKKRPMPEVFRKLFRGRKHGQASPGDDPDPSEQEEPGVRVSLLEETEAIPLVSDDELSYSVGYAPTGLDKKDPGRRERIATAVLSVMIRLKGKYSRNMSKQAVMIADELAAELDATAWETAP